MERGGIVKRGTCIEGEYSTGGEDSAHAKLCQHLAGVVRLVNVSDKWVTSKLIEASTNEPVGSRTKSQSGPEQMSQLGPEQMNQLGPVQRSQSKLTQASQSGPL